LLALTERRTLLFVPQHDHANHPRHPHVDDTHTHTTHPLSQRNEEHEERTRTENRFITLVSLLALSRSLARARARHTPRGRPQQKSSSSSSGLGWRATTAPSRSSRRTGTCELFAPLPPAARRRPPLPPLADPLPSSRVPLSTYPRNTTQVPSRVRARGRAQGIPGRWRPRRRLHRAWCVNIVPALLLQKGARPALHAHPTPKTHPTHTHTPPNQQNPKQASRKSRPRACKTPAPCARSRRWTTASCWRLRA